MSLFDEDDVRDVQGRGAAYRELHGHLRPPAAIGGASYCDTCRLFHGADMACDVARAAVMGVMVAAGDQLRDDDELEGVDRPALLSTLRARGMSLEPSGERWIAVKTLGDGVPLVVLE